ncbi:MAG: hypothetical protein NLN56_06470 [Nitrosopumilus sp.]|nr:hypothetical protein [Nitrosopumilus sp.]
MSYDSEKIKNVMGEKSKKLAELGSILAKNQFTYKIQEKTTKEYWEKRVQELKKYDETSLAYYNEIQNMMELINKDEAQTYLLHISKFRQLSTDLIKIMEKIKENPSIIDSKDKQQSLWSKGVKKEILEISTNCVDHEKYMNSIFREFYETKIKEILE